MSLMASFQSSVTILGYPAEMYLKGTQFWMVVISAIIASITAAELFLPIYYKLSFTSVNKVSFFFLISSFCEKYECFDKINDKINLSLGFLLKAFFHIFKTLQY